MKNRGRFVKYLQVERNVPMKHNRLKLLWFCIKFGVFLMILGYAVYGAWSFFNNFSFRTPIIIQSPIVPNKVELIISPVASDSAKLKLINVGEIADRIFTLESSNGRNVLCPEGTYNGYGFRQNSFEWVCYPTQDEVRMLVIEWLVKNISKYGLEQALCRYNVGIATNDCKYVVNYKSL